ncbi:MAG TPA: VTT domain-containing protein, partial [Thermoanaerobaculia bacterium]
LIVLAITAVAIADPLRRAVLSAIDAVEPMIQRHSFAGAVVFVLLSALSAMVVFFSTAVITPIAVEAFGPRTTLLLLWFGWCLGGMAAYAIGRFFGRRVVIWFVDPKTLQEYESRARTFVSFGHIILFQLAVPSEIPGYILGLARCRFRTFAAAMILAELPFAIGAVYLGESFLRGDALLLLAIGVAGVALSWTAFRRAAAMWSR